MRKIIPCLDIKNGRVVKGVNFEGLKDMGDPIALAKKYSDDGADELVFLDITRTIEGHGLLLESIEAVKEAISIPLTIGGGVQFIQDIETLLEAGADRVAISSQAVKTPEFINEASQQFGSDAITIAIDAGLDTELNEHYVYTQAGQKKEEKTLVEWALEATKRGAGRLLITSIDRDGVQQGFDLDSLKQVKEAVDVFVVASGGAGSEDDFVRLFKETTVEAGLAASIFHQDLVSIRHLKEILKTEGVEVA